jgi:hypothetical protein
MKVVLLDWWVDGCRVRLHKNIVQLRQDFDPPPPQREPIGSDSTTRDFITTNPAQHSRVDCVNII